MTQSTFALERGVSAGNEGTRWPEADSQSSEFRYYLFLGKLYDLHQAGFEALADEELVNLAVEALRAEPAFSRGVLMDRIFFMYRQYLSRASLGSSSTERRPPFKSGTYPVVRTPAIQSIELVDRQFEVFTRKVYAGLSEEAASAPLRRDTVRTPPPVADNDGPPANAALDTLQDVRNLFEGGGVRLGT